jgi:hypothetical protein
LACHEYVYPDHLFTAAFLSVMHINFIIHDNQPQNPSKLVVHKCGLTKQLLVQRRPDDEQKLGHAATSEN